MMTTTLYQLLAFLCTVWVGVHGHVYSKRIRQLGGETHLSHVESDLTAAGSQAGVPTRVLAVVAHAESGLDPEKRGKRGELGYMQLLPGTNHFAQWRALCRQNPAACDGANMLVGARYLRGRWDQCRNVGWEAALSAYRGNGCTPRDKDRAPFDRARKWGAL